MRSTWSIFTVALMASMSFVACAQSVNDATIGAGDDDGDDQAVDAADAPDSGHHDYNNHDTGTAGDTGGGNAGDATTPPVDAGGGTKDAGPAKDSGTTIPDAGNNTPDTGPVSGGGSLCDPSNIKYVLEYALLAGTTVACTDGSECSSSECCEIDTCLPL